MTENKVTEGLDKEKTSLASKNDISQSEDATDKLTALITTFQEPKETNEENDSDKKEQQPCKDSHIILHYSASKMAWDWMVLTLTFYTAVVVPMVAAFRIHPRSNAWLLLDSALDLFFFVDVAVNFHTTYVGNEGMMVTDLKRIRVKYATTWFPIDILSCLPYDAVTLIVGEVRERGLAYMLSVLKACRLLRLIRIARDVDRYLEHAWATLIVLVCLILLISHWMACGWYNVGLQGATDYLQTAELIALKESRSLQANDNSLATNNDFMGFDDDSVLFELDLQLDSAAYEGFTYDGVSREKQQLQVGNSEVLTLPPKNWLLRLAETSQRNFTYNSSTGVLNGGPSFRTCYISCMYFTMTNVISAGFGNIAAETTAEKIYCIGILMIGGLLYAAILGNVTNILQQFNSKNQEFWGHMKAICDFASLHDLPKELSESICDYISYTRAATHGISVDKVLTYLPEHKRGEVCVHLHKKVLSNQPVFKRIDENGIRIVAKLLRFFYIAPGDILYDKGEQVDAIYFVISGSLEVLQDGQVIAFLTKGDCFGTCFWGDNFTGLGSTHSEVTVQALTYVSLDFIPAASLITTMKTFPIIDRAFRNDLHLMYNLRKLFIFRTTESVQWERNVADDPEIAQKAKRLKKWMKKVRQRKQQRQTGQLNENVENDEHLNSRRTNSDDEDQAEKRSTPSTWRSRCLAVWKRIRFNTVFLRPNKVGLLQNSSPLKASTQKSTDVEAVTETSSNKKLRKVKLEKSPVKRLCKRCGKPINITNSIRDVREEKYVQNEVKVERGFRKHSFSAELIPVTDSKDVVPMSNEENATSTSKNTRVAAEDATSEQGSLITATSYRCDVDERGNHQWVANGEVSFTLESKVWMDLDLPEKLMETLCSFLDFKENVGKKLKEIDSKLTVIESLLENVSTAVKEESNLWEE